MKGNSSAIEMESISVVYDSGDRFTHALDDISLTASPGEFLSIVGPSGCGKTTLLRVAAGLLEPGSGTIRIVGKSPTEAREARDIGFVFQEPALLEWRTSLQNVVLPLEIARVPRKQALEKARSALDLVGLASFADSPPRHLSGGMKQRVSIARALVTNPSVLLMDEPFGALDQITRDRLNLELLDIWSLDRPTVLFVTHSLREALFLSDKVVTLSPCPGRVLCNTEVPLDRPRQLSIREEDDFRQLYNSIEVVLERALRELEEESGLHAPAQARG